MATLVWLSLIVGWLFCAVLASVIASSKGADSCLAFFLGLLFGPLGILIAAVLPSDPKFIERQHQAAIQAQVRQGTLKQCPFCLAYIPALATTCQHCGREQPAIPAIDSALVCPHCHRSNPPDYKFCGACGQPLGASP